MKIGIDASNLRGGGGITHLVELLRAAHPAKHGIFKVIVWSGSKTLAQIQNCDWLEKKTDPLLDGNLFQRVFWQRYRLKRAAKSYGCDLLFVPGGSDVSGFKPLVTMSRNMLPFEWQELKRYGWSLTSLKLIALRWTQTKTFQRAEGLIFLTDFARDAIMHVTKLPNNNTMVIPHGINKPLVSPHYHSIASNYSMKHPFNILYVSAVTPYKHQWHVAEAVAQLRKDGLPITLSFVGPAYPNSLTRLQDTFKQVDPTGEFIRYHGPIPHAALYKYYTHAALCLFASSCENLPNILLEGMVSSLPIVCSNRGPMPEVLGDAGVYFDPEQPAEIATAIKTLFDSPELRAKLADKSFKRAQKYSWKRCADETFTFIAQVAGSKKY